MSFKELKLQHFHSEISSVTSKEVNDLAKLLLQKKPAVSIIGKDINKCMSY